MVGHMGISDHRPIVLRDLKVGTVLKYHREWHPPHYYEIIRVLGSDNLTYIRCSLKEVQRSDERRDGDSFTQPFRIRSLSEDGVWTAPFHRETAWMEIWG